MIYGRASEQKAVTSYKKIQGRTAHFQRKGARLQVRKEYDAQCPRIEPWLGWGERIIKIYGSLKGDPYNEFFLQNNKY